MAISSKSVISTRFKETSDNYGRLYSQFAQKGAIVPYYWSGYNHKGNQGNRYIHLISVFGIELLLLGRSRCGVGAGVGVDIFRPESESELESLEIRGLRSPEDREPLENEFRAK